MWHSVCQCLIRHTRVPLGTTASLIREPRLSDQVADLILKGIVSRGLEPGAQLPSQRELGQQFGVSRTVIREAIKALAAKGLVDVRVGSGIRVAAVNGSAVTESLALYLHGSTLDYTKVHEIRAGLEVQMAAAAAERRTPADVDELIASCELVEATIHDPNIAAVHDVEFHCAVGAATHNELYAVLLNAVGGALLDVRRANLGLPGADRRTIAHHRRILETIEAGDGPAAADAMRAHLEDVEILWNDPRNPGDGSAV